MSVNVSGLWRINQDNDSGADVNLSPAGGVGVYTLTASPDHI